jgi:hypothetical protein
MTTEIINQALDLLEEEPALSIDDDRDVVRWMRRNYEPSKDALLRRHPWNFAIKRATLAALSAAPAFGWDRAFQLPPDCLRLFPLTESGGFEGPSVPYALEERKILTDAAAPLKIRYVFRVEDASLFDPLFVEVLAQTLAMKAANWITRKQSYTERLSLMLRETLSNAQFIDGLETFGERAEADDWIIARFEGNG